MQVQILSSVPLNMTIHAISFGTSGHRGILGDSFTLSHVCAIAYAVADLLKSQNPFPKIVLGYDPRQGNSPTLEPGSLTHAVAAILSQEKIHVYVLDHPSPTPLVSWVIEQNALDGGLILTASHNPPDYNGIKFNDATGAPAPIFLTQQIEKKANLILSTQTLIAGDIDKAYLTFIDKDSDFSKALSAHLSTLESPSLTQLKLAIDVKHGTTGRVWKALGKHCHFQTLFIHDVPMSDFGGLEPNPTKKGALDTLKQYAVSEGASLSVAHDPDGDRHVILDETGAPLTPEETALIIGDMLLKKKLPLSGIVTTLASSRIIRQWCDRNGLSFDETEVGFKYFAPYFQKARDRHAWVIGVESSGGISASVHTMEKCGFFPVLMVMAALSLSGKSLSELKKTVMSPLGQSIFIEEEYHFEQRVKPLLGTFLAAATQQITAPFFENEVAEVITIDGLKINFYGDTWVLLRLSGTEPVARIYAEASELSIANSLVNQAKGMLIAHGFVPISDQNKII